MLHIIFKCKNRPPFYRDGSREHVTPIPHYLHYVPKLKMPSNQHKK